MRVCNVKPSLCCGGFTLACNRAAGSGSVGSLPSWTVLVVVMDLSKLWSPHKSQPDDGTPPAVDPPLEPVTQAQPRMAAGMARSLPAGTSTHPAGLAAGATPTHLAGPPASHINVGSCVSVWRLRVFAHKLVEGLIVYRDVQSGSLPWQPSSQAVSDRIEESLSLSYPPVPSAQKF